MTTQSINETAQPVKAAITEADVFAFILSQQEIAIKSLSHLGPFAIGPYLYYRTGYVAVMANLPFDYKCVSGTGDTLSSAIVAFMVKYNEDKPSATKLRDQAARLLEEAAEIEAKQGGAK
jgi:hydroxymethylpyrimidine/phosphomethylpyrimidine kinase